MVKLMKYGVVLLIGMLISYNWQPKKEEPTSFEDAHILRNSIQHVSKLVVSEHNYSEVFNYKDAKKYLFETVSFEKKLVLLVNATVRVTYDLNQLLIEIEQLYQLSNVLGWQLIDNSDSKMFDAFLKNKFNY